MGIPTAINSTIARLIRRQTSSLAAFEHLIGSPGRHYFSLDLMFADQQVGGSPDVTIGDHSGIPLSSVLTLANWFRLLVGVLIAPKTPAR